MKTFFLSLDDVEVKFDGGSKAYVENIVYSTRPLVLHGNAPKGKVRPLVETCRERILASHTCFLFSVENQSIGKLRSQSLECGEWLFDLR